MCTTTSPLSCCSDSITVQDKVCINWALAAAATQIIYTDNISQLISGTGYVKFEIGTGPLTATFTNNGATVLVLTIPAGGSSSFTISRFDTLTLTSAAAAQGEFCITVRYKI